MSPLQKRLEFLFDFCCNAQSLGYCGGMKTNEMSPQKYNETFNALAQRLGCRARIEVSVRNSARYGRKVRAKYFEVTGEQSGRELMYPVDAVKFDRMMDNYPQLKLL